MKDAMLDIETLGYSQTAVITQIGACYFDRDTGEIGDKFMYNVDIASSLQFGHTVDADTLKWWMTEQKDAITFFENPMPIQLALDALASFLIGAKYIWSHATFDFPIIMHAMKMHDVALIPRYTAARDIRTLSDLAGGGKVETKNKKTHNALDDCLHQVEYCVEYFKRIKQK